MRSSRIDLADSALHAPQAGFGDEDFYPDLFDKAAILCWRLARNHALPDGNKRAAWAALTVFIDLNGGRWEPDPPDVDEAEEAMLDAAAGKITEESSPRGSEVASSSTSRTELIASGRYGRPSLTAQHLPGRPICWLSSGSRAVGDVDRRGLQALQHLRWVSDLSPVRS